MQGEPTCLPVADFFLVFWSIHYIIGVFCLEMQSSLLPNYNLESIDQTCIILATVRVFCLGMHSCLLPNHNLGSIDPSLPLFFTSYNRACLSWVGKKIVLKVIYYGLLQIIISP